MTDDGNSAKIQQPEGLGGGNLAEVPNLVLRLRTYAHIAHAAAAWGFAGEGWVMDKSADMLEQQAAEIEHLHLLLAEKALNEKRPRR